MAVWNVIDHTEVSSTPTTAITKTGLSTSYDHMYLLVTARFEGASAKTDQIHLDVQLGTSGSVDSGSNYSYRYVICVYCNFTSLDFGFGFNILGGIPVSIDPLLSTSFMPFLKQSRACESSFRFSNKWPSSL